MTLPDERPRGSVANLIGRFEHKKSSSTTGTPSSPPFRSSSVISHTTGDSTKEEIKEKKEWPPRNASALSQNNGDSTKSDKRDWGVKPSIVASGEWPPKKPEVETSQLPSPPQSQRSPLSRESSTFVPPPEDPVLEPEVVQVEEKQEEVKEEVKEVAKEETKPQELKPAANTLSQSTRGGKAPTKVTKTPSKVPAKGPPSSFGKPPVKLASKVDTPRKVSAPTTGTSTPGKQSRPSSRAATARAKTPSGSAPPLPGTPSKTRVSAISASNSTPARAKTPSMTSATPRTGLYAPTAASLAKARSADSQTTPIKKTLFSSASMDRLSKPTASSLSKARGPSIVNSPPPPRRPAGTPVKARVSTPSRIAAKPAAAKKAAPKATATSNTHDDTSNAATEVHENGHTSGHEAGSDSVVVLSADEAEEHVEVEDEVHAEPQVEEEPVDDIEQMVNFLESSPVQPHKATLEEQLVPNNEHTPEDDAVESTTEIPDEQ